MEMPEHEKKRLKFRHDFVAHRTPTLVGCAIAIRKDYFLSIGGFDDDMNIWGGENIELAFRVWLCGGQVGPAVHRYIYAQVIVIVNCIFLQRPQKRSRGNQLINRPFTKKAIGRGHDPERRDYWSNEDRQA